MTLAARGLVHRYGRLTALDGIDAVVPEGRLTVVLGPNAAGKSTLLKCLIGALRPDPGEVLLDDRPVRRLTPREIARRIAYVPQRSSVAAAFTVRQVVELGRYALAASPRRVDEALQTLELAALAERPYPRLSTGQQQRVTMARALAQHEDGGLLVLDEPVSAMDLAHVGLVARILRGLVGRGSTVLLSLHDITFASAIAEHAWVLDGGRLAAAGPAGEVLTPAGLEPIFGVGFRQVEMGGGGSLLVPEADLGPSQDVE